MTRLTPTLAPLLLCCLCGCGGGSSSGQKQYTMVTELVAAEDIPAGTLVKVEQFRPGKLYYKGEKPKSGPTFEEWPPALFPSEWLGTLAGKKLVRELKKDEKLKIEDLTEPDGSPFRKPVD